jgi:nucleoside-diphosphate-sugar epimerase
VSYALVLGAGGFVGGHLVGRLVKDGHEVVAVDRKSRADWWQDHHLSARTFDLMDVSEPQPLELLASMEHRAFDEVYHLAADTGGVGYVGTNHLAPAMSVKATVNVLEAAAHYGWGRVFYASSAAVYPRHLQREGDAAALREQDAYPAEAEGGHGWERLFGERLCRHFQEEGGLQTRVARLHAVYGPCSPWRGGREQVVTALCRQVAEIKLGYADHVAVWGDGTQVRSFTHSNDCVEGILRIARSNIDEPLNLGFAEGHTVDELLSAIEYAAEVSVERRYLPDAPHGVRSRSSDNTLIRKYLDWEPSTALVGGVAHTYAWVEHEVGRWRRDAPSPIPRKEADDGEAAWPTEAPGDDPA